MPETWFVSRDGQQFGPFTAKSLRELVASSRLVPTDLLRKETMGSWVEARRVKGLFSETEGMASQPPPSLASSVVLAVPDTSVVLSPTPINTNVAADVDAAMRMSVSIKGCGWCKPYLQAVVEQRFGVWKRAAESGEPGGQWLLGACFFKGLGVQQDHALAVKWFRLAAEQGLVAAQDDLGGCYRDGSGVVRNDVEAFYWFHKPGPRTARARRTRGLVATRANPICSRSWPTPKRSMTSTRRCTASTPSIC